MHAQLAIAAGLDERVALFAALYVLLLAILSPLMSARSEVLARRLPARLFPSTLERARHDRSQEGVGCHS